MSDVPYKFCLQIFPNAIVWNSAKTPANHLSLLRLHDDKYFENGMANEAYVIKESLTFHLQHKRTDPHLQIYLTQSLSFIYPNLIKIFKQQHLQFKGCGDSTSTPIYAKHLPAIYFSTAINQTYINLS
jgi:hypothetical protein